MWFKRYHTLFPTSRRRFSSLAQKFPRLHADLPEFLLLYEDVNFFGRGLVTKEDIAFGSIIFKEDPLYRFEPKTFITRTGVEIEEIISREIDEDTHEYFMELHLPSQYEAFPLAGRVKASAYPGRLYGLGSLINHNCWPNIAISDQDEFIAIRDIKAGEELFTRYGAEVDKSICIQNQLCKCHFGNPDHKVNQKLRIQGSLLDYYMTHYSRKLGFQVGDAAYLYSPSTQVIWEACEPTAKKLHVGRGKRTNRIQFWQGMFKTEWVEQWFEATYPKYLPLMEAIHDRKCELLGHSVPDRKRKIKFEVDPNSIDVGPKKYPQAMESLIQIPNRSRGVGSVVL